MGVYIKGMEMPQGCFFCICNKHLDPDTDMCILTRDAFDSTFRVVEHRRDDCPLVPVPEPHGRLVDLNALYEKFVRLENEAMQALKTTNAGSVNWIKWSVILTERTGYKFDIADAPTIIPAEEEEA